MAETLQPTWTNDSWWTRLPLKLRLVGIIVILLTAGLTIAAATMLGILQAQLIGQVNSDVTAVAQRLASSYPQSVRQNKELSVPSNFYARIALRDGTSVETVSPFTTAVAGVPKIGNLIDKAALTDEGVTEPVVVESSTGTHWVAVAAPINDYGMPQGVVTVAQPLTAVHATMYNTATYLLISSLILIFVGGVSAYYLVRLTLKPLREIEAVAGRIADGDLSQRIDKGPEGTEVGSLANSLNTMLSRIETSFQNQKATEEKMRRFVSDASHELRTPLAAIRGYGELYHMDGVSPERVPDIMNRISSEAVRMGGLVEDLLKLARLDEGRRVSKSAVDIVARCRDAALDLTALNPSRDVSLYSLDGSPCPEHLWTYADPDQLSQILMNLVGNIDRYTPPDSPVEFLVGITSQPPPHAQPAAPEENGGARPLHSWVVIEVRDHGPGVSDEELPKLFQRFYRGDSSRSRSTGGTGLGLSIVAAVAQAHGGVAMAAQTAGGGLTVHIMLRHYDVAHLVEGPQTAGDGLPLPSQNEAEGTSHEQDDSKKASSQASPSDIKKRIKRLFKH